MSLYRFQKNISLMFVSLPHPQPLTKISRNVWKRMGRQKQTRAMGERNHSLRFPSPAPRGRKNSGLAALKPPKTAQNEHYFLVFGNNKGRKNEKYLVITGFLSTPPPKSHRTRAANLSEQLFCCLSRHANSDTSRRMALGRTVIHASCKAR